MGSIPTTGCRKDMKVKYNRATIVDVECTCWPESPPNGERMEIIEIGCVILENAPDKRWEILDKFGILVTPQHSTVSQFCEDLTGITQKALDDNGIPLEDAMEIVKDTNCMVWSSCGMWDYDMLKKECQYKNIKMWKMLPIAHLNAKALYSAYFVKGKKGLATACGELNMPFVGKQHRGADDAENVALILRKILNGER